MEIIKVLCQGALPPEPPVPPASRPATPVQANLSAGLSAGGKSLRSGGAPASPEPPSLHRNPLQSGGLPAGDKLIINSL